MATSMGGGRGLVPHRTGQSVGNQMTGANSLGTSSIPKGYQQGQLQQFTPEQMDLFQQLFSQVGGGSHLGKLAAGDESEFEALEKPAFRQLGELQGGLASRFSGMGSFGGRRSSGHNLAQGSLASEFAEKLSSQRMGLQRQAQKDLFGLSGQLLSQRPFDKFLVPEEEEQLPWWQQLLIGAGSGLGQGLGAGLTGGVGSGLSALSSLFNKGGQRGSSIR